MHYSIQKGKKEMNAKCWQTPSQFDIFDFGIDLRSSLNGFVFGEDLLFDFVDSDIGLG